jgi:hypothetical protein
LAICDRAVVRLIAIVIAISPQVSAAFGPRGHQIIGAIADQLLTANAKSHLDKNLGLSLRAASTWADCAKHAVAGTEGEFHLEPTSSYRAACSVFETPAAAARMVNFVRRNWSNCSGATMTKGCHATYHYTDVSIQHDRYDRAYVGTSDHDVVSALSAAIAVLQDKPQRPPFAIEDKAQALLLAAHLVGDIHQPLHVGSIYLDDKGRRIDPDHTGGAQRNPSTDTRGGNRLEDGDTNLHAEWDDVPRTINPARLRASMLKAAAAVPTSRGAIETWPTAWAGETIGVARKSFEGISFVSIGAAGERRWEARFDDRASYFKRKDEAQTRQLTLAGARLAQLLNSIWP